MAFWRTASSSALVDLVEEEVKKVSELEAEANEWRKTVASRSPTKKGIAWAGPDGSPIQATGSSGALTAKKRVEMQDEAMPLGQDDARLLHSEIVPVSGRRSPARRTDRSAAGSSTTDRSARGYMDPKGKVSARFKTMRDNDEAAEETARKAQSARRQSARASADRMRSKAAAHPLATSRPKPQRWRKRPDDWKHEKEDADNASLNVLWDQVDGMTKYGLPMAPQEQSRVKVGRNMSEKERLYQLEKQLENRERKALARLKEKAKEELAVQKLAETTAALQWYHKQREKAERPIAPKERKAAQQRLYAVSARKEARVYG